jgi:hypothetical protein
MTDPEIVDEVFSTYLKYRVFDYLTGRGNGTAKNDTMLICNSSDQLDNVIMYIFKYVSDNQLLDANDWTSGGTFSAFGRI